MRSQIFKQAIKKNKFEYTKNEKINFVSKNKKTKLLFIQYQILTYY